MSAENKAVVLRHHEEIWSKGNLDAIDAVYAPAFVGHHAGAPDWIGPESVKLIVRTMRDAFPDFTETIEDVVAEGDRVVTRFTSTGTHLGSEDQ
jgi:ketosteroid isomerase-like protein